MAGQNLETRLRASQHYNRSVIEACPGALVVTDADLSITDVNEGAISLTGYARKDLIGNPLGAHFALTSEAVQAVRRTFDTGAVSRLDLTLKARSGDERAVSLSGSAFLDPSGSPRAVFLAITR